MYKLTRKQTLLIQGGTTIHVTQEWKDDIIKDSTYNSGTAVGLYAAFVGKFSEFGENSNLNALIGFEIGSAVGICLGFGLASVFCAQFENGQSYEFDD